MKTSLLKISAVLWIVWGLVHLLTGVLTVSSETATALAGIADGVDPALLKMAYPDAVTAVVNQHGFNLGWIGTVTIVSAVYIWRAQVPAIFLAALVGGLADVGDFIFIDLGGYNRFAPGTVMTLVAGPYAYFTRKQA